MKNNPDTNLLIHFSSKTCFQWSVSAPEGRSADESLAHVQLGTFAACHYPSPSLSFSSSCHPVVSLALLNKGTEMCFVHFELRE